MTKKTKPLTSTQRVQNRTLRIKDAGLYEGRVVMDKGDKNKVQKFAKKLYEKRGKKFN